MPQIPPFQKGKNDVVQKRRFNPFAEERTFNGRISGIAVPALLDRIVSSPELDFFVSA